MLRCLAWRSSPALPFSPGAFVGVGRTDWLEETSVGRHLGMGKSDQVPCLNLGVASGLIGECAIKLLTLAFVGFQVVLPELLISNGRIGDSPARYRS